MDTSTQPQGFLVGIRQILIHGAITLLAIVIAFSLPPAARYILYVWWPRVETDTSLLLVTEIGLASALVLLFNLGKVAWDNRNKVAMARLTALVYARNARNDWLSRLRERAIGLCQQRQPPARHTGGGLTGEQRPALAHELLWYLATQRGSPVTLAFVPQPIVHRDEQFASGSEMVV